ncbi:dienelactone hydrolase family protein [Roseibacillus persicicus]|uniref:DeoR family transcriptional regulator n=1 Tax=Roseibacillus persicicus TaxID=454148 RepID=A0A918TF55_9BACT|nr:dienelactone hydrolase family protein [Roseibacillus persicicus]GHC44078.1 DeoR family transcriptional regulator [Roseibacillus persicicus]
MKNLQTIALISLSLAATSSADIVQKKVSYTSGETKFEGVLVYDDVLTEPSPSILMVPNWMGVTEAAIEKAIEVAGQDRVVFVADMYGVDVRPADAGEAGKAAGAVRADRAMMRSRAQLALDTFLQQEAPTDKERTAAIGFCFGGGTVLELGRTEADLDAIVSFHGDLVSPTLEDDAAKTKAKVLVLHGAADPFVPQEDVAQFEQAMLATEVDWQLVQFSNTVHSFTDPEAKMTGKAEYNETSSKRAFTYMDNLFSSLFTSKE